MLSLWIGLTSGLSFSVAESITSPVMGSVSRSAAADSDTLVGLPMTRTALWVGELGTISGNQVGIIQAGFFDGELVSGNDTHYLLVTSGPLAGHRFTITANTVSEVTVDPGGAVDVASQGLAPGHTAKIIPYWTLSSVFPGGRGITGSPNGLNPTSTVKVYDRSVVGINLAPAKTYFYYSGTVGPNGWYDNDALGAGLQDHVVLLPESCIVVRCSTTPPEEILLHGELPSVETATPVGRLVSGYQQDNMTCNPYPLPLTLGGAGLIASGAVEPTLDPRDPTDTVKLYANNITGYNPAPQKTYFYYAGPQGPHGWYDNDALGSGLQDDLQIAGGAPIVIRKGTGDAGFVMWIPPLPYTP